MYIFSTWRLVAPQAFVLRSHQNVMWRIPLQVSREGERLALGPNLKARGALEDWLLAMEENMRKVLHRLIKMALVELEGISLHGGENLCQTSWSQAMVKTVEPSDSFYWSDK